jgi:hypothetical protein
MKTIEIEIEVDIHALRLSLAETAAEIRELKRTLRQTWTRPMAVEQRALHELAQQATLLCILRAYLRGRHHLQRPMRRGAYPGMKWDAAAYHRQAAEHAAERYGLRRPAASEAVQ